MKLEELRDMFRKGKSPPESMPEPVVTKSGGLIYAHGARSKNDYSAIGEGTPYYEACKIVGFEKGEGLDAVKVWFEEELSPQVAGFEGDTTVLSEIVYDANGDGFIKHLFLVVVEIASMTNPSYGIFEVCYESNSLVVSNIEDCAIHEQAQEAFRRRRNSIIKSGRDIIRTQSWSR